jgi:D-serine deaminase-like pyridoxal phosphate-dependent protein
MWNAHTHRELTEYRAGIYVYGDRLSLRSGAATIDTCALKLLATVVSRPTAERGILDAGSKTLSTDLHGLDGYGSICEYPEAKIYALSEEHGHVDFSACARKPEIGERDRRTRKSGGRNLAGPRPKHSHIAQTKTFFCFCVSRLASRCAQK